MKIVCKQCGATFELSDSEIEFYRKKNLHLPKRCKECRQENRQKQGKSVQGADNPNIKNTYRMRPKPAHSRSQKWLYGLAAVVVLALVYSVGFLQQNFTQNETVDPYQSIQDNAVVSEDLTQDEPTDTVKIVQTEPEPAQDETVDESNPVQSETIEESEPTQSEAIDESEPAQDETIDATEPAQSETVGTKQYYFRNAELLNEHFDKHGAAMGFATAQEYQAAASAVVNNPNALHKLEAEDGDDVYYLEATNEFVIVSTRGYIRTYFYPDSGIEYYNRQ